MGALYGVSTSPDEAARQFVIKIAPSTNSAPKNGIPVTAEEFKKAHPIEQELSRRGIQLVGGGEERKCKCPFHNDKTPSMSVNVGSGLWKCFAGCGGGDVITLICRLDNKSPAELLGGGRNQVFKKATLVKPVQDSAPDLKKGKIEKVYPYYDAFGRLAYQVVRLIPKSFRQRHADADGNWVWNMDGVERVLYQLPQILKSETVVVCEGEKDADTITRLGWCGTTNVGGGGKWMDAYTESLAGKEVIVIGDNDEVGHEHVQKVFESVASAAKWVKLVKVPEAFKDVTEYVESFTDESEARACIARLIEESHAFYKGVEIPIYSMAELESRYEKYAKNKSVVGVDLSKWLPSFRRAVRQLVPGEFALIIADTGAGKTACLQNIAIAVRPLPTVMFEVELPAELLFERFLAARSKLTAEQVEEAYSSGDGMGQAALSSYFQNLLICDRSKLTVDDIEALVIKSELKFGVRPNLVLIDYIQLLQANGGSRYDRASSVAESLKRLAKSTGTVVIAASQRSRPGDGDTNEVFLHDAKDSGSLENSAGLVIGAWRDQNDSKLLKLRVLKNTKGKSGLVVDCNFDGEKMLITERASPAYEDD